MFNGDVLTQIDLGGGHPPAPRAPGPGHDRADAGRQPDGLRAGRDRRGRQHPRFPREAEARRDHHQQHQRRHLHPRAGHLRPDSERRGLVDRAQLLPVAHRARRDVRRATSTTATGSTSARPEKYTQVHRDIMDGRYAAAPFRDIAAPRTWIAADARIEDGATIEGPCFIDEGVLVKAGARDRALLGDRPADADRRGRGRSSGAIIWPNCRISREAVRPRRDRRPQLPRRPQRHRQRRRGARRQDHTDRLHKA